MPLPFNKALDLKLISLVRDNPLLYNPAAPKHSDLDTREVTWQRIGDALNRPAQLCKSRWVNIRDMMRRKLRERCRNPQQLSYHYRYEDELSFMIPHFRETASISNSSRDYSEFDQSCDIEDFTDPAVEFVTDESPNRSLKSVKDESFNTYSEDQSSNNENEIPISQTPDRGENWRSSSAKTADPLEVFLLTIGSTLRKFSPYYLNQAKSKIFQIVQDYELEQICKDAHVSNISNSGGQND